MSRKVTVRLATMWKEGGVRPTHRSKPSTARRWRTRVDPFAEVWSKVFVWLESEPDRTAKELLARLQMQHPNEFTAGQLRTLQRRVKEWRMTAARRLVFSEATHRSAAGSNVIQDQASEVRRVLAPDAGCRRLPGSA